MIPFNSVHFCFVYLETLLLLTYTLMIVNLPMNERLCHYEMSFFISGCDINLMLL